MEHFRMENVQILRRSTIWSLNKVAKKDGQLV